MKKLLLIVFSLVIFSSWILYDRQDSSHTYANTNNQGEVTADSLHVREQPTTNSASVGSLTRGNQVTIDGESGDWYQISYQDISGFVHSSYILREDSGSEQIIGTGEVTASSLNVRATASTNADTISSLSQGTVVDLYEEADGWFKVKVGSTFGYIHGEYVEATLGGGNGGGGNGGLNGKTIFLDPGHGGNDPGAVENGSIYEKTIALSVSNKLKAALESEGATVVTSRTTDTYVALSDRASSANQSGADIFISIHANSWHDAGADGIEVLYERSYEGEASMRLAQSIQSRLASGLQLRDRGIREENLHVLRNTTIPSVLVELGFMSNPSDLNKLQNNQDEYVNELVNGLKDYY